MTTSASAAPTHEALRRWWREGVGGPLLYQQLRRAGPDGWSAARDRIPEDDGPEPLPAPDRPPARMIDLPEVLALRALLQDRRVAFDTVERWIRALTQSARSLDETRPLEWSADHVAQRCADLAHGARAASGRPSKSFANSGSGTPTGRSSKPRAGACSSSSKK